VFLPLIWLIPKVRDSCVFLWSGPLPFSKGRYCSFFCLDAKETKDQGKSASGRTGSDRSARLTVPGAAKPLDDLLN